MSVPRPTRLRPGPGEHDITTSISKKRAQGGPEGGKRPARTPTRGTCFRPRQHPSNPGQEQPGNPGRTPDTWHGALWNGTGGLTTATAGCPQRGAHGVKDPRHLPTPPSGAGDQRWHHSPGHLGAQEPAHRPTQTAQTSEGRAGFGTTAKPGAPHAPQRPTSLRRVTQTACQHLPGNKKCSFQGTK